MKKMTNLHLQKKNKHIKQVKESNVKKEYYNISQNIFFHIDYEKKKVQVCLLLISFKDENGNHILYSPHLDLSGIGENIKKAKESFQIAFEDFTTYIINKNTVSEVLKELGWEVKTCPKKFIKSTSIPLSSLMQKNNYLKKIIDKYPIKTISKNMQTLLHSNSSYAI